MPNATRGTGEAVYAPEGVATMTYIEAISRAMWEEMERDESVFLIGEDIGAYGGAFKATKGFLERFGEERVIDSPLSEAADYRCGNRRGAGRYAADRGNAVR